MLLADHACYPCTTILLVSSHSRLTLMSLFRPMSCIPHLVHVSRHLFKLLHSFSPNCTIVCTTTGLEEVYYTAIGWLSDFLYSFPFVVWAVS